MEKECCNVKVVELDNGLRFEVTGDRVKERAEAILGKCCENGCCIESVKNCCSK